MRAILRPLAVLLALALPVVPARADPGERDASKPHDLKRLRVLLVIDNTDPDHAVSVERDRQNVQTLLEEHIPKGRRQIDCLEGRKVTREEILKYYRDLETGPDEALLFFFAGHGGIDPKLGHCLQMAAGDQSRLPRADVRKAMEQKRAGLVVLLTDCCSTRVKTKPLDGANQPLTPRELHPVFRCLFFQHRGTVDITAAEDDSGAFGDDRGGVFTSALVNLLQGDVKALDTDHDGFVSWKEIVPLLSKKTEENFKDFADRCRDQQKHLDQKTQRPSFLALPDAPSDEAKQTYAVVSLHNDGGKPVHYRYRWSGEKEWKVATVSRKGHVLHKVAVSDAGRLPTLEIEAVARCRRSFKPAKWAGRGRPEYKDGNEYNINAR
ncbi:MAG TPA: caspase family protein [Gemmataceae bacterium]|nr:caspase family protein [Gemmataceae bacterium]